MKVVINIPTGYTLHHIENEFPNRVRSYSLTMNCLIVTCTNWSEVSNELFSLELVSRGIITKYTFTNNGQIKTADNFIPFTYEMR